MINGAVAEYIIKWQPLFYVGLPDPCKKISLILNSQTNNNN